MVISRRNGVVPDAITEAVLKTQKAHHSIGKYMKINQVGDRQTNDQPST